MNELLKEEFPEEETQRIIEQTKNKSLVVLLKKVIEKYSVFDTQLGTNLTRDAVEYISATAEETKSSNAVKLAMDLFLLNQIDEILKKYKKNRLNVSEVFSDIGDNIHRLALNKEYSKDGMLDFKKYLDWLNNGLVSRFLRFVEDFPNNGITPIQQNIFSVINISPHKLDIFNQYAERIYRKKISMEKKIEIIALLSLICSSDKEVYAEALLSDGIKRLNNAVEKDLNIKLLNNYSLVCGINFLKIMNEDQNLKFIYEKVLEYKSCEKWFEQDIVIKNLIELLNKNGFDSKVLINSGKIISQKKSNGHFSENWVDFFKGMIIKILGSKTNELLPKISIPNYSPGSIFKKIKNDYILAINGDKNIAKNILLKLTDIIKDSYKDRKIPQSVTHVLIDIESLIYMIDYGVLINYKGAKLVAKVWKRRLPQDLYDANRLWCCWFLPTNEKNEIPLFFMDPKATILQFYVQGVENPIAIAFLYAGKIGNENSMLLDTWEGGPFTYISLGQEKMHEFVLNCLIKFARKCGCKKLAIYAHPKYTRAKEFGNFFRDRDYKLEKIFFEAIDSEDTVLKKYSQTRKHHVTDAFGISPLKGEIEAFVFNT